MEENLKTVGITGTIGSGKTTTSNILREKGYYVLDSDCFSRIVLNEKETIKFIEDLIGEKIMVDSNIDYKKIGNIFDKAPDLEKKFEKWFQPFLGKKIIEKITLDRNSEIVFCDIPLLYQKGVEYFFDRIWLIESTKANCFQRVRKRNNYPAAKVFNLIENSKIPTKNLAKKYAIINNDNDIKNLKDNINYELEKLKYLS